MLHEQREEYTFSALLTQAVEIPNGLLGLKKEKKKKRSTA